MPMTDAARHPGEQRRIRQVGIVTDGHRRQAFFASPEIHISTLQATNAHPAAGQESFESWRRDLAPDLLFLDVEPEDVPAWFERMVTARVPMLLPSPVAGSPEELDRIIEAARTNGVQVQLSHPYVFQDVFLRVASFLEREGLRDSIQSIELSICCDFPHEFAACADRKPDFDALLAIAVDGVSLLQHLGADISKHRLTTPISPRYHERIDVEFTDSRIPLVVLRFFANRSSEPLLRLSATGLAVDVTVADGSATLSLDYQGRKTSRVIAFPSSHDHVLRHTRDMIENGHPFYEDLAASRPVFIRACEIVDEYLYEHHAALALARTEQLHTSLVVGDSFYVPLSLKKVKNRDVSFASDLDLCNSLLRPLRRPFSLLLVRAPMSEKILGPPLSLAQLAAVTRKAGVETDMVDLAAEGEVPLSTLPMAPSQLQRLESILSAAIGSKTYDLIGVSVDEIVMWPAMKTLCRNVLRDRTEHIVLGSRAAGYIDRSDLQETRVADYVVEGEGELSLLQLIRHLTEGEELNRVSGLWFRGWPLARLPNPSLVPDFSFHPPPNYDGLDLSKYSPPCDAPPAALPGLHVHPRVPLPLRLL